MPESTDSDDEPVYVLYMYVPEDENEVCARDVILNAIPFKVSGLYNDEVAFHDNDNLEQFSQHVFKHAELNNIVVKNISRMLKPDRYVRTHISDEDFAIGLAAGSITLPTITAWDHDFEFETEIDPNEVYIPPYILYMECYGETGDERNTIADNVSFEGIDFTGGKVAFEDGDLEQFYTEVLEEAAKLSANVGLVCRMPYPGLGIDFDDSDIEEGLMDGSITVPAERVGTGLHRLF